MIYPQNPGCTWYGHNVATRLDRFYITKDKVDIASTGIYYFLKCEVSDHRLIELIIRSHLRNDFRKRIKSTNKDVYQLPLYRDLIVNELERPKNDISWGKLDKF